MKVTDEKLMLAYCAGDDRAFEELYLRHKQRVYFYIRRFVARDDLIDEIYQEAFTRLHSYRDRYQPTARFTTFLYTIVHRLIVDRGRNSGWRDIEARVRPERLPQDPPDHRRDPEKETRLEETQRILRRAMDRLPERRRSAVLLHDVFGYTAAEVGEALDCTTAAAKMTIFRGRRQLREVLAAGTAREELIG